MKTPAITLMLLVFALALVPARAHGIIVSLTPPKMVAAWSEPNPPANPGHFFVRVDNTFDYLSRSGPVTLETLDAGKTFVEVAPDAVPRDFTELDPSQTGHLAREVDAYLRSRRTADYFSKYGERLPEKSAYWNATYLGLTLAYLAVVTFLLVSRSHRKLLTSLTMSATLLGVSAFALSIVSTLREMLTDLHIPPSASFGFLLHLATRPASLLPAFAVFAMLLPSTLDSARPRTTTDTDTEYRAAYSFAFEVWRLGSVLFWLTSLPYAIFMPFLHLI